MRKEGKVPGKLFNSNSSLMVKQIGTLNGEVLTALGTDYFTFA